MRWRAWCAGVPAFILARNEVRSGKAIWRASVLAGSETEDVCRHLGSLGIGKVAHRKQRRRQRSIMPPGRLHSFGEQICRNAGPVCNVLKTWNSRAHYWRDGLVRRYDVAGEANLVARLRPARIAAASGRSCACAAVDTAATKRVNIAAERISAVLLGFKCDKNCADMPISPEWKHQPLIFG